QAQAKRRSLRSLPFPRKRNISSGLTESLHSVSVMILFLLILIGHVASGFANPITIFYDAALTELAGEDVLTKQAYLAVAGLLAILVGAGLGVAMMVPPAPGVTKANFDRIEIGMKITDVEVILGKPATQLSPHCMRTMSWTHDDG